MKMRHLHVIGGSGGGEADLLDGLSALCLPQALGVLLHPDHPTAAQYVVNKEQGAAPSP